MSIVMDRKLEELTTEEALARRLTPAGEPVTAMNKWTPDGYTRELYLDESVPENAAAYVAGKETKYSGGHDVPVLKAAAVQFYEYGHMTDIRLTCI